MTTELLVYPCGTPVKLKNVNVCGFITAVVIRSTGIAYEISFFLEGSYLDKYFYVFEFDVQDGAAAIVIGFKER